MMAMRTISLLMSLFLSASIFLVQPSLGGRYWQERNSSKKVLFVFGDSYADTGNWKQSSASCWYPPYGITFPGKPAGRFSDGRILTDYLASYLNITSPTPYEQIDARSGSSALQFGVNFAYGGTGVFSTDISQPNMTSQINLFENLITKTKLYNKTDLQSSIALVSIAGNDYANYLKHGSKLELKAYIKSLIDQLVLDLQRIHNMGVPKVVVTAMPPLGCLPVITSFSGYKNCLERLNNISIFHNELLQRNVHQLSKHTKQQLGAFFMLDLYDGFLSILEKHTKLSDKNLLQPCCQGISGDFDCGSNEKGQPKYTLCQNRSLAFFWDTAHLTQHGWYQVYNFISPSLINLF